jgi:hypothetical protein
MLKTGKKPEDDKGSAYNKITDQKTQTTAPSPGNTAEKTVIGENISIEGNIHGDEHLVIEGSMKGKIEMEKHNFTVGSKGRVEGEINAQRKMVLISRVQSNLIESLIERQHWPEIRQPLQPLSQSMSQRLKRLKGTIRRIDFWQPRLYQLIFHMLAHAVESVIP